MMTLGEYIRSLRNAKELSQPELARLANIEQSYLSKLENDKSIPSNDILRQLINALAMSLSDFLSGLDKNYIAKNLNQIPDIEHWLLKSEQKHMKRQRQYMYMSSLLIVIAVTCFYAGFSKVVFSGKQYQYESHGVVLSGEPSNVFANWSRLLDRTQPDFHTIRLKRELEIERRKDASVVLFDTYLGDEFIQAVEGGKRRYRFDKEIVTPQKQNALLQILGVLLFTTGIMGFVLEKRIYGESKQR